jgi:hypothetical protein
MQYVFEHGKDRILGFDYSKYDKRIQCQLLRAAMKILIVLAIRLGYSDDAVACMIAMHDEFCKPVVDWNGTLFQFLNSNPSGNNLTVILNSIVNALLVRSFFAEAWMKERNCSPEAFRRWVHCTFYGDDALMTVKKGMKGFNNIAYRDWLGEKGMKITPPQKDQEFSEFLAEEDADFLKRKSVYHPDFKCEIGALEPGSITKFLYYRLRSSATDEEHLCSSCASCLTEATLHGRAFFEQIRDGLLRIEEELDINIPALRLTYDQRVERWHKRFRAEP